MITVLGRRNSMSVQKVMWALGEIGVAYERHDVGGSFGYPADYPNPNPVVPTLIDNDLTVWESGACVRHLARTYGTGSLWPNDRAELAIADQWMEWHRSDISFFFFDMFRAKIRLPVEQQDAEQIAAAAETCGKIFAILDRHLAGRDYVAGQQLTMGDIPLGAMMYRYFELDIDRPSLPNMEAWYARLCDREAYRHHVMIPFGKNLADWQALEAESTGIHVG